MDAEREPAGSDAEQRLLETARGGDVEAFAELWRRHARVAASAVRGLAHGETEDIVAEAFAQIWAQLRQGGGPRRDFRAYLVRVAKNLAARRFRQREAIATGVELELLEKLGADPLCPEQRCVRSFERELVRETLRGLPERWRLVLQLRVVEGLPVQEVGERMGLSPNSVSALARRARAGFARAWSRVDPDEPGASGG